MDENCSLSPNVAADRFWQKVPGQIRWTFVMAVVMGLVTHMYAFTNDLLNHDDIYHLLQCEYGAQSGRWFLPIVLGWDGTYSMPWLIGALSVLCLALTACFTVSLLRIQGRLGALITVTLLVAYPTVAAVLMVGALLFDTLDGELSLGRLFLRGVKMVLTLGVAIAAYMVIARWVMRNAGGLTDYMGISEMGHLSLGELPSLIVKCYQEYGSYFWNNGTGQLFTFAKPLIVVALVMAVVLLLTLVARKGVGLGHALLAMVLAVLYPLAGDLIHVMVAGGAVHDLMLYGTIYLLVLPLALASYAEAHLAELGGTGRIVTTFVGWVIVICMSFTAYSYVVTDNKAYLKMSLSRDQLMAYSNRLISAVEQTPGYTPGMTLVLTGSSVAEPGFTAQIPELSELWMVGVLDAGQLRAKYSYGEFLRYYMAYPGEVYLTNSSDNVADKREWAREIAAKPEVVAMPNYPAEGSIAIIDGVVVVKLNAEPEHND